MASGKIKGITIEIGGDTTKLGKALAGSEKQTRSLQGELKEIEKLLKFDPTNTELLAQKQKVLSDMIVETSNKLDVMKEAEAQVVAQFEEGKIGEDQLRSFQREIVKTEQTLSDMKEELKTATRNLEEFGDNNGVAKQEAEQFERATKEAKDALEAEKQALKNAEKAQKDHEKAVADAKKELKDFGDKAKEAGEKVEKGILAIGTATVAGAGYAVKLSTDFDKAFNTLQTRTGATAEEMIGLNEAMENVYKNNFGESIEDVAESMAIVKTNTKASADEIEGLTEKAILLRDTFDFEINESTRSAKMLMDQFGISGEQAYNLIAQGAQAGLDKNGDLLDTVNEYSVHYKQLGYTSEEFFNSLVNGASSGTFSVDKLGDAMKEFGIRAKDTATTTDEGFQLIGLDADAMRVKFAEGGDSAREATAQTLEALFSMEDQVKQNQAGVDLFGTMWEDLGIEGVKALMNVNGEASLTSDALAKLNEQKYDDLGSTLQGLGRTIETDIIDPIGDDLKPVVEDAISYVQENGPAIKELISEIVKKVGEFVGFVVDNGDAILSTIAGIGAGFVTWNVATMISGVAKAIKAFQTANEGATVAQALFNAVLNANPIVLIVSLIAMLVAGIITFIATNDEARAKFAEIWGKIKEVAGAVVDAIVGFFKGIVDFFKENWQTILLFIVNPFAGVFKYLYEHCEGFRNFVDGIVTAIKDFFVNLGQSLADIFLSIWTKIVEIFSPIVEWFTSLFTSIWTSLSSIISVIIELIRGCWEIVKAIFSIVVTWFNDNVLTPVKNAFSAVWTTISTLASNAWESIKNIFSVVAQWFNDTLIQPVSNFFSEMWEKLKNGASDAWTGITSVFSSVTTWFRDKFSEAWTAVKKVFSIGGKIFSGITEGITSAFKKIVNGIIGGINKVVSIPFNAINGVLDKIRSAKILDFQPFKNLGSIAVPQIPLLAKGGIVRGATPFIAGENGAEAIVPLENNTEWINRVAREMNDYQDRQRAGINSALLGRLEDIYNKLDNLKQSIVLDSGVLVGETINQIDAKLATNYSLKARGI